MAGAFFPRKEDHVHAFVLDHADSRHPLTQQWAALSPTTPFNGWEVFQEWNALRRPGSEPFVILLSDEYGKLAAVAPWCIERDPRGIRRLTGIGGEDAWYHDPWILRPELAPSLEEQLVRTLQAHCQSWDVLSLILRTDRNAGLRKSVARLGLSYEDRVSWRQHQKIDLGEDWSEYWSSRPRQIKDTLTRKEKRLKGIAHRFQLCAPEEAEATCDKLFELQAKRLTEMRDWKSYHEVLRVFCRAANRQGSLLVHKLEIDGGLAAASIHIRSGNHVFAITRSFDEAYNAYSPGSLLAHWTLQKLHREGIRSVDPGPGLYGWKEMLKTGEIETVQVHAASPSSLKGFGRIGWEGLLIHPLKTNPILQRMVRSIKSIQREPVVATTS